jgi:hypothetical protein
MSTEQNTATLRRAVDHWNNGDLTGYLDLLYDRNCVIYGSPQT